jgi:hypothetical protein
VPLFRGCIAILSSSLSPWRSSEEAMIDDLQRFESSTRLALLLVILK